MDDISKAVPTLENEVNPRISIKWLSLCFFQIHKCRFFRKSWFTYTEQALVEEKRTVFKDFRKLLATVKSFQYIWAYLVYVF